MSVQATEIPRTRPRRTFRVVSLSHRILATHLATAGVSLVAALLAFGPAVAEQSSAVLLLRFAGATLLAAAAAFAIGSVLARQVSGPIAELRRVIDAGWVRFGGGATRTTPPRGAARSDEISQLSAALLRLVEVLSDRATANETLAADIAHEIRNPLTSLRAAAEAMGGADDERREQLAEIIEQDVSRLDRLVGDITSTSRLDTELVREQASEFDLLATMRSLIAHLSRGATARGIEIITDLPDAPVLVTGLEPRLGQVIVNLIENAVSLCEDGDAVRVWLRRREGRVLIAIEDTGPGIPDGEAEKIFRRFYTQRPAGQFGGHSGLGLAIARQIVEAHDGVVWAENIRPTESDILSEPLGARFVVVLPQ